MDDDLGELIRALGLLRRAEIHFNTTAQENRLTALYRVKKLRRKVLRLKKELGI